MFVRIRPPVLFAAYPKAFWYLLIGMLINGTATFVLPFETIYLVAARHFPVSQASAIVGVYGIGSCLSALAGGLLADTIGRRPTILIGLLGLAATTFCLAVATDIWLIAILTGSMGFWISWYRPASSAVVADIVPLSSQARANGLIYWSYNIGMAISPLLASVIVQHTGYVSLFCADGLGTVLFCLLLFIGLPETRPAVTMPTRHAQHTPAPRTKSILRDVPFLCFVVLSFVLTSMYFQNASTLPADMQIHGLSAAQYGIAISINGIVVVLFGLPLSHLLARCTPFRALAASALLVGAGLGLTALADQLVSLPFYAGSIAVWTLGEIIFVPVSATVVAAFSPDSRRGIYQGIARTSWGLSACVGPLVGGFVLQLWSVSLWIGCAVLGMLVACGFVLLGRLRGQRQASEEDIISLLKINAAPDLDVFEQQPGICEEKEPARENLADVPVLLSSVALSQKTMPSPEMEVYLTKCVETNTVEAGQGSQMKNQEKEMSRYTFPGENPRYRIVVGVDAQLFTLFAQVEDMAWEGQRTEEDAEIGDTLDEGLLVWVGGCFREILDVQELTQVVSPYGHIPLTLQVHLLQDLDRVVPQPLMALGAQLAAICQQSPIAILKQEPELHKSYYLLLNQDGWQLCDWETLPVGPLTQAFSSLIYPAEYEQAPQDPEMIASSVSDPSILFSIDAYGFAKRLPVFTLFTRGAMLSGPVVISNEGEGLTPTQVHTVQQEVLFVDEAIRPDVSALWYHAWRTISTRGIAARNERDALVTVQRADR